LWEICNNQCNIIHQKDLFALPYRIAGCAKEKHAYQRIEVVKGKGYWLGGEHQNIDSPLPWVPSEII